MHFDPTNPIITDEQPPPNIPMSAWNYAAELQAHYQQNSKLDEYRCKWCQYFTFPFFTAYGALMRGHIDSHKQNQEFQVTGLCGWCQAKLEEATKEN